MSESFRYNLSLVQIKRTAIFYIVLINEEFKKQYGISYYEFCKRLNYARYKRLNYGR
jgi:hypothetical protein